jgi:microcystin-dependent protein
VLFAAVLKGGAQIAVPKLVNYQGRLTDAAGQPLSNGTYQVKFELFKSPSSSDNLVWGASYAVAVVSGQFNVVLGAAGGTPVGGAAVNDISFAFGDSERYLQMSIISGTVTNTLAPRQQILSAPYAISALHGVPAGTVVPFAGTVVPEGWTLCDASSKNGLDPLFARLFAAIGLTYGGSGTQFNVPDLRSRTVVGAGQGAGNDDQGQPLSVRTLNQKVGAEKHVLTKAEIPTHTHSGNTGTQSNNLLKDENGNRTVAIGSQGSSYGVLDSDRSGSSFKLLTQPHTHAFTTDGGNVGVGGVSSPHNNMQPSIAMNYIIKL